MTETELLKIKDSAAEEGPQLLLDRIKQLENDLESTHVHAMQLLQSNNKMHSQASIYVQEIHSRDMKIEQLKALVHWYEVELAKVRQ
ncbi:YALIA101S06e05050g1_1 [Yarrowia lipolytica]|jgi:hypothetical protein|nr:Hypothetical protein YALI2_D00474g [Yarrowia lipolytica]RMI99348.1 hypothetical protein BD777DRAFT_123860 [Yarrowia lipolytica]SEI35229.1 YALIA101S06e05050g1_1 [Yarrowia lipolytica]